MLLRLCLKVTTETVKTMDLSTTLGRFKIKNPIMTASGTFGYAREMQEVVELSKLGAVVPKTITAEPRIGNKPWRTVETAAGLLNAIGLDNDGVDAFLENHLPYLQKIGTSVVVSLAGRSESDFVELAERVGGQPGVSALELNLSCPNVSGGIDFGTNAESCRKVVEASRAVTDTPIFAKLTPNVTNIAEIAQGAADGGADAVCLINTVLGIVVDWKRQRPMLGNGMGGLSGPAIKPIALRCVHQVAQAVDIPIIGIGGVANIDDVMQFLVTGASAVQIGTANYYDPTISTKLVDQLPEALGQLGVESVSECIKTLQLHD